MEQLDASAPLGDLLPTSATLLRELKSTGELDFPALGAEPDDTWLTLISRALNLDTTLRVSLSGPKAESWRQALVEKGVRTARLETGSGETQGLHLRQQLRPWLEPVALPRRVRCVAALPRNSQGKLPYLELKELFDVPLA